MGVALSARCQTCQDTRHVPSSGGAFRRCPRCFHEGAIERQLVRAGYPAEWASLTLDRLSSVVGESHPLVGGLRTFLEGHHSAIHLYSAPSPARQAAFAVVVRGLVARHGAINVFDTAELTVEYFKDKSSRRDFDIQKAPIVLTIGREIERKIGMHYLRLCLEYAASRRVPIALFSDHDVNSTTREYFGFQDLADLVHLQSFNVRA